MPWTKPYRNRPEKFLAPEALTLVEGGDIQKLPWAAEGFEFVKPVWHDLVGSLGAAGSDNWRTTAWIAKLWAATKAEKKAVRDTVVRYFEAAQDKWMGDERGAIYFPFHLSFAIASAKWARKEKDFELLALCHEYILWACAMRAAVTYEGVCYWIGQRSAGINYTGVAKPGSRSFGSDLDLIAAGKLRGLPKGQRGKNWTEWDHILHECWQEVYEAAKPLRDGENPLAILERLAFRLLEPVYVLVTEDGFATWEERMRSGDTQAVLGVVKRDGKTARYLPADCANDAKNRKKGGSRIKNLGDALLYSSPVYGEQEEPLPTGLPITFVRIGGTHGGVDDLLEDEDPPLPEDPPEPPDPPVEDDDPRDVPPVDPESDSEPSWWRKLVEAWKEWWSGR